MLWCMANRKRTCQHSRSRAKAANYWQPIFSFWSKLKIYFQNIYSGFQYFDLPPPLIKRRFLTSTSQCFVEGKVVQHAPSKPVFPQQAAGSFSSNWTGTTGWSISWGFEAAGQAFDSVFKYLAWNKFPTNFHRLWAYLAGLQQPAAVPMSELGLKGVAWQSV